MRKLLIFLMLGIFLLSFTSALELDNVLRDDLTKTFDDKTSIDNPLLEKYPPFKIDNLFGLGKTLVEGYLDKHTETCGVDCSSTIQIKLGEKGVLIDDVYFKTLQGDESWVNQNVRSYQFYIKTDEEEYSVDDYEWQCINGKYNELNKSYEQVCSNVKVGSHLEKEPLWEEYTLGTEIDAGVYEVKLDAEKKSSRTVDWVIKTQGEWIESLAVWGSSTILSDLISYYKLDESSGTVIDTYGSNDGTNYQAIPDETGIINTAYEFDGTNDYINLGNPSSLDDLDYSTNFTFSAWINSSDNLVDAVIISKDGSGLNQNQYHFSMITGGQIRFAVGTTASLNGVGSGYNDGNWHYIVGVYNGTPMVYVDGSYVGTGTSGSDIYGVNTYIGNRIGSGTPFGGLIDEVGIWDRALTPTEITSLYNSGNGLPYPFGEAAVTLNSPADTSISDTSNVQFSATAEIISNATLVNRTLHVWYANGTLFGTNFTSGLSGTSETTIDTLQDLTDGDYLWNKQYCDSDGDCGFALNNYSLSIDTVAPTISVESPTGTLDYGVIGNNETLNVTFTDTNLDSCRYNYNGTNITIGGCISGIRNSTEFILETNNFNMTIYTNDTGGNENSEFINWSYTILENSQTYSTTTTGTSYEDFTINFTYDSSAFGLSAASLWYNGTEYVGTNGGSGDTVEYSSNIQVPTNAAEIDYTFYWTIALTNGSGTYYWNSSETNQTVSPIVLSICGGAYTTPTLNFTLKEEGTFDLLNGSLEATFDYWSGGDGSIHQTYSFSNTTDNNTNYQFCISPSNAEFITDATISYYKTGYDRREYLLDDYTINNDTEDINLYLLSTATTDIFTFTVQDENNNPVKGATIRVQRWDIGTDNFYNVGMVYTSDDGTGIINMRLNDAWYRYQVLYEGTLYLTTDPVKEAETTRLLQISLTGDNPYLKFNDIDYSLTYSNVTNVTIFEWADTTGAVQTGCLKVIKLEGTGTTEMHYSCVESSSSALSYEIPDDGSYIIRAIFRLTSEYDSVEKIIDELVIQGTGERFRIMGSFGQVISLLLIGTAGAIGIAAGNLLLALGLIVAALITVFLFGWLNIQPTVLYLIISIVLIIAINLGKKR